MLFRQAKPLLYDFPERRTPLNSLWHCLLKAGHTILNRFFKGPVIFIGGLDDVWHSIEELNYASLKRIFCANNQKTMVLYELLKYLGAVS